jgi:hypothetical protein
VKVVVVNVSGVNHSWILSLMEVAVWQLAYEGKPYFRNKNCLSKNPRMLVAKPATEPVSQTFRI